MSQLLLQLILALAGHGLREGLLSEGFLHLRFGSLFSGSYRNFTVFEDVASKLEKIDPIFSSFSPFPSLPSTATDERKQFQCRNIVFDNKTSPLVLEFS